MEFTNWLVYLSLVVVATASPGPAMALVATISLSEGILQTAAAIAGNATGLVLLSGLSILGLSAILVHSPLAFTALKLFGAIYLIYLGVRIARRGLPGLENSARSLPTRRRRVGYLRGFVVAISNPKALLFTMALFPQFLSREQPLWSQFTIMVTTLIICSALALGVCAGVAVSAGRSLSGRSLAPWLGLVLCMPLAGVGGYLLVDGVADLLAS
jgi:homoserine/homoserine lactone efflux protein